MKVDKEKLLGEIIGKISALPTVWISIPEEKKGYHRQVNLLHKQEVLNILTSELGYTVDYESI